jgi:predicted glycosyltransferase
LETRFRHPLDTGNKNHLTRNLIHRLERLGYAVTLTPHQKAALTEMMFMADF